MHMPDLRHPRRLPFMRPALSFVASAAMVTSALSAISLTTSSMPASAAGHLASEISVPARPSARPVRLPAEPSQPPLTRPVWPAASQATVRLRHSATVRLRHSATVRLRHSATVRLRHSATPAMTATAQGLRLGAVTSRSTRSPSSVRVKVLARRVVLAAGGQGIGVDITRDDGVGTQAPVRISISYAKFATAYGADFAGRLRLVTLPACALTTPSVAACSTPTFVRGAANNKAARTITGVVPANPDPAAARTASGARLTGQAGNPALAGSIVTLAATDSSDGGDFRASPLSITGSWSVSPGSGDFSYSLPIKLPPPAEGTAPDLALGYDSQSVDGLTSSTNTQASGVGLGWSLNMAYIERGFRDCEADGQGAIEEDLCWYSPYAGTDAGHAADSVYTIVLNGQSSQLVPDANTPGRFHLTDDPGWYVVKHGSPNSSATATTSSETWEVFSPDGTIYHLGYGSDYKTGAADGSVLMEPVFGNDTGEPCNSNWSSTEDDRKPCLQAWRWMLDTTISPDEVVTSYHYSIESNSYRSVEGPNMSRSYDMDANLTEIDYGWAEQLPGTSYTDKVVLDWVSRCTDRMSETDPIRTAVADCPSLSSSPTHYPDVPTDKICSDPTGDTTGCASPVTSYAPVYFSTQMLWNIKTYTLTTTGTATEVMDYQLKHDFHNPAGSISDFLWLDYVQREGFSGTGSPIVLPVINFNGADLDNIVGSTDLEFRRITTIDNDLGGITTISYGLPDACTSTDLPTESSNTMDCFKQTWTPDGSTTPQTGWFKKYVVTEIDNDPNVGTGTSHDGDPVQTISYDYSGGKPGWRFPANPLQQRKDESWTEWRGYSQVVLNYGAGTQPARGRLLDLPGPRRRPDGHRRLEDQVGHRDWLVGRPGPVPDRFALAG